ncbi:MAG: HAMP domain-containing protein [Acidobacteria bacterium]|nr:HAMP domain-containing protein [Acidobacteriota bacterium]
MNSLFAKILLWLLLTAVVTATGAVIVMAIAFSDGTRLGPLPARVLSFLADDAQRIYLRQGPRDLETFMERFQKTTGVQAHLLNSEGRDLADSSDQSELLATVVRSPFRVKRIGRRIAVGRSTSDGKAVLLLLPDSRLTNYPLFVPQQIWVLICVAVLSYLLARYLTAPLRRLDSAVKRLGEGDLTVRVPVERSDETGRLGESFNQMAGRIEQLVASQQRLLLDVSHELRSPLARLNVAVELARGTDRPNAELDIIQQQADRLNALVGSLLQVSRAEADPAALRRERVDLRALVQDVSEDCRIEAEHANCSFLIPAGSAVEIEADPELLRRALENILRNAIRFSPPDEAIDVTIQEAAAIEIRVRDRGPGVPEHSLPFLFDAFYRVEGQHVQGSGLGLSIARRAVELHGGRISARNTHPGLEVSLSFKRLLR